MADFTFHVLQPDRDPVIRTRALPDEAEALSFARQLQADWPESEIIDVLQAGQLVQRLRRRPE